TAPHMPVGSCGSALDARQAGVVGFCDCVDVRIQAATGSLSFVGAAAAEVAIYHCARRCWLRDCCGFGSTLWSAQSPGLPAGAELLGTPRGGAVGEPELQWAAEPAAAQWRRDVLEPDGLPAVCSGDFLVEYGFVAAVAGGCTGGALVLEVAGNGS